VFAQECSQDPPGAGEVDMMDPVNPIMYPFPVVQEELKQTVAD
jgi:hypothetical protein